MNRRVGFFSSAVLTVSLGLLPFSGGAAAAEGLWIALTGLQPSGGRCVVDLNIGNDFDQALDRFAIDVVAFDADEEATDRVVLDLAPLSNTHVTEVSLPMAPPCAEIGRVTIYGIPRCRLQGETELADCHAGLLVVSRIAVPLTK